MAAKKDVNLGPFRVTQEQDAWLRMQAAGMGMDLTQMTLKCYAYGISIMRDNEFARRVELDDVMNNKACKHNF